MPRELPPYQSTVNLPAGPVPSPKPERRKPAGKTHRPAPPLPRLLPDRTRVWRTRNLIGRDEGQLTWALEELVLLIEEAETVMRRACADADTGMRSAGGEAVSGGRYQDDGSVSGPVPNRVLSNLAERLVRDEHGRVVMDEKSGEPKVDSEWRDDPARKSLARLLGAIVLMRDGIEGVREELAYLNGLSPERARELVELKRERRPVECSNPACRRWVQCTSSDRIRAGRCEACARYFGRHGRERARDLCRADTGARADEELWPRAASEEEHPDGYQDHRGADYHRDAV